MPEPDARPEVDAALDPLRRMLEQDGYALTWHLEAEHGLSVRVAAGPDACAECLVPTPMMEAIVERALAPTGYTLTRITLPATG